MKLATRALLAAAISAVAGAGWSAEDSLKSPDPQAGVPAVVPERRELFTDVVDLNIIPSNLLARMDVVTGGAIHYGTNSDNSPPVKRVISCNFTMREWRSAEQATRNAPPGGMSLVVVDTMGGRTSLPSRAGETLSTCSSTGTGDEVLLVFRLMKGEQPWQLARVIDSSGKLLAEIELDRAGTVEFTVAGKQYLAQVPAPGTAAR